MTTDKRHHFLCVSECGCAAVAYERGRQAGRDEAQARIEHLHSENSRLRREVITAVNFLGSEPAADPVLQRLIDDIASHIMSKHV